MDAFMVQQLLPVLTGHCSFSDDELKLLYLPARLGGIGFPCMKNIASQEFEASRKVTAPQVKEILRQGRRSRDDPVPTCSAIHSDAVAMKGAIALERRKASINPSSPFDKVKSRRSVSWTRLSTHMRTVSQQVHPPMHACAPLFSSLRPSIKRPVKLNKLVVHFHFHVCE